MDNLPYLRHGCQTVSYQMLPFNVCGLIHDLFDKYS
jgi:hypothetical protein